MEEDLLTVLRTSSIFSSLPKRTIRRLLPHFKKIELDNNEILYQQGDPSDSIEIVLSGNLSSHFMSSTGETRLMGMIGPGETVGELGVLSNEPRTTTITATQPSILFKLPSDIFLETCRQFPAVVFALINPIATRSQQIIQSFSSEKFIRHVLIVPVNLEVKLDLFLKKLTENIGDSTNLILIADNPNQPLSLEVIQNSIEKAKAANLKKLKQKFIYVVNQLENPLTQFAFERAEKVYLITHNHAAHYIDNWILGKLDVLHKRKITPELIILHDENTELPHDTLKWLELTSFRLHHHVRIDRDNDYERLIRFIRNKPVGLVLGGGGTRGWGHAGAILAITEAGIPIDAVGGASVGSLVAASYALTLSAEKTLGQFTEIIEGSRGSVSWRSLTWPSISLFSAKGLTLIIQKLFTDIQIEDLWIPYFCISTNMSNNTETVHTRGSLWIQTRASISIPGVIPPMVIDGKMYFDGGLLNNLPVDIMRNMIGFKATIVAVELTINSPDTHHYNFPPILTFWRTLLSKLKIGFEYKFPRFIDTFLKSLIVGSFAKAQQNALSANLLVTLDLSKFPMLHSNPKLEKRIVDIGYDSTMQQIKNRMLNKKT